MYIITATNYLTRWAEATPVRDCSVDTATRFIFENIITRFGFPRSLTSYQGVHFINRTIATLTHEFFIQYHTQANFDSVSIQQDSGKGIDQGMLCKS
jgi:hypothetical protein